MRHVKYTSYDENELKIMARWLKSRWLSRHISTNQSDFAKQVLGVSQSAFAQMLNGVRPIPEAQFHRLCAELSIDAIELYEVLVNCREYRLRFARYVENSLDTLLWLGVEIHPENSVANQIRALSELLGSEHAVDRVLPD